MTIDPEKNVPESSLEPAAGDAVAMNGHAAPPHTAEPQEASVPAHENIPLPEAEISTAPPIVFDDAPEQNKEHVILEDEDELVSSQLDPSYSSLQSFLSVIVIALFVITFVVQAFQIPSESMERTLLIGDYLLVDKVHFGSTTGALSHLLPYREIRRGDIVVFHYPVDPTQHFVKRVIGIPGDHIRMVDKNVYVNGVYEPESYVIHKIPNYEPFRDNFPMENDYTGQEDRKWRGAMRQYLSHGELVVPPGQYFVMGDNRDQSLDSRYWGFVPRNNIVGRPLVIYLSLREGREPHPYSADNPSFGSGSVLAHVWQFARWDRIFHLVR